MKMVDLMGTYFSDVNEEEVSVNSVSTSDLPVQKRQKVNWKLYQNPSRFGKKFKFKSHSNFLNFVIAVLQYEDHSKHNAKITIGYPEVVIEVWTHKLEQITEADRKYCKEVDHIFSEL